MIALKKRLVVAEDGAEVGVLLDMRTYRRMLKEIEELESIRAFDSAKAVREEKVPYEQAIREIEKRRR